MRLLLAVLVLAGASVSAQTITQTFGTGANAFSIDFVEIGNPGNAADTTGSPNPVGQVNYVYNLGKYEISRDQIEKANTLGSLGIILQDMTSFGGNGVNKPATGISWSEVAKFVNWLNTSRNYQAAYNFDGSGNFQVWSAGQYSGSNQYRHKDAQFFLPSLDEWYKGAYGSLNGQWYNYATGSDALPLAVSEGTASGTAVYGQLASIGPADITNAGGLSAYETMAQGGNVSEWTERWVTRGGNYASSTRLEASASSLGPYDPNYENNNLGFRISMVPEPSSFSLLLAGGLVALARRRKS